MKDALLEQPAYQLFRRAFAERKAPLVIICGSGLSSPAGLPTWPRLREKLQVDAEKKELSVNQIGAALLSGKVNAAKNNTNMWVAFKLLKEILTPPVFDQLVEHYLTPDSDIDIPHSYIDLLALKPRGVITLNLDKFAGEALARTHPGELTTPIFGTEIAQRWNTIQSTKTYLVYLHGAIHDPSTWVLTQDELSDLTKTVGHAHFIRTIFTSNLVLMVGVSADDLALSSKLLELRDGGFKPKNIYWLTSRHDNSTNQWAADNYVSIIHYAAQTNDEHIKRIKFFVDDCLSYNSTDEPQPPLTGSGTQFVELAEAAPVDPDELAQRHPEEIRKIIAGLLDRLLLNELDDRNVYDKYRDFCERYDYAVHRAFYRGRSEKFRSWFGYRLAFPALGRGNFGEVYAATSPNGEQVAVKIMHESIFGNNDMLGGFRRGVRSMRIVTEQSIDGMVPIKESFELPPTIVMPYVSGHSLQETLEIRKDLPWNTKLEIIIKAGKIVAAGHALPQTILHRDLKPSNIMVTNLEYHGSFDPDIVVLDFDMSWHKGSKEKDVVFESRDDFGFLAPEQTDPNNRYAARSTRVDSYGYGMTIYYTFGGVAPRPNEALSDQWKDRATKAAGTAYSDSWKSAPNRLGRLITRATEIDQSSRIDFATMVHNLEFLKTAVLDSNKLDNPELWAEELLIKTAPGTRYVWDDAVGQGGFEAPSGVSFHCSANFRSNSVQIDIRYVERGFRERSHLAKDLSHAVSNAERALTAGHWKILESWSSGGDASVRAVCHVEALRRDRHATQSASAGALSEFYFS